MTLFFGLNQQICGVAEKHLVNRCVCGACHATYQVMIASLNSTPISSLTFGTMQFGGRADEVQSRAMYDAARAAGITHFDTAYVYNNGASETLLGEFIKDERDSLIIATKVGYEGGGSRDNILTTLDISRKRMGIDVIDILYMHRFDDETDLRETIGTLADVQARGQIRHIAVSNYAGWQLMKAQSIAASFETRIDMIQPMYNLVKRQAEVEIFPCCVDQGIEIAPYSPLGGGLLTGKYASGGTGRLTEDDRYAARYGVEWMHETAKGLKALADREGVDSSTLAVAWAMAHPARPRPIISARSVEQLKPSLTAGHFRLAPELYAEMTALTQTPAPATDRLEEA